MNQPPAVPRFLRRRSDETKRIHCVRAFVALACIAVILLLVWFGAATRGARAAPCFQNELFNGDFSVCRPRDTRLRAERARSFRRAGGMGRAWARQPLSRRNILRSGRK